MPVFLPNTTIASYGVKKAGTLVGTEPSLNLIEGANVGLTIADNAASNRVDVTIAGTTTSYLSALLATGPKSVWNFDETTGTTASDINSLVNGTYTSTYTLGQAALPSSGSAFSVKLADAGTGSVELGTSAYPFSGLASYSWSGWFTTNSLFGSGTVQPIVHRFGSNASGSQGYAMQIGWLSATTYDIESARYVNGSGVWATAAGPYSLGQRHFVVTTYDGTSQRVYVDGSLQGTSADTRSLVSIANSLTFGNVSTGTKDKGIRGLLDVVAVHDYALAGSTVSTLYSAGL